MKKLLTIIILTLTASIAAKAQEIQPMQNGLGLGVRAGLNVADITSNSGSAIAGLKIGAFTDYYFNHKFGLELGIYYNQLGLKDRLSPGTVLGTEDYRMHYANLQLNAKYHVARGFRVFLGGQAGYAIDAFSSRTLPDATVEYNPLTNINRWEGSGVLGVGYTFKFGLDLEATYTRGFTSVFNDQKQYNSVFAISVGWRFIGHGGRATGHNRRN